MKKQKTQLITILVVLAVMVAAYFALSAHNKKVEEDEATDDYTILTMDTSTITEVKLTTTTATEVVDTDDTLTDDSESADDSENADDSEETLDESDDSTQTDSDSEDSSADSSSSALDEEEDEVTYEYSSEVTYDLLLEDGTWYLAQDKSLSIDQDTVETLLANLESVTSNKEIADVTDFDQYGLEHPAYTIDVTTSDGTTTSIYLGDYNSVSSLYYVRIGDSSNVYLITSTLKTAFNVDASSFETVDSSDESDDASSETSTGITDVDIDADAASAALSSEETTDSVSEETTDSVSEETTDTSSEEASE